MVQIGYRGGNKEWGGEQSHLTGETVDGGDKSQTRTMEICEARGKVRESTDLAEGVGGEGVEQPGVQNM